MTGRAGRAPWLVPEALDPGQRRLYDAIVAGPRGADPRVALTDDQGRLSGPFNVMLQSPEVGEALQALGAAMRYRLGLSERSRELAILEVARARRSEFEWYAHVRIGLAAGLTDAEIEAIRVGDELELSPSELIVRQVTRTLLSARDLDDDLFNRTEADLGPAQLNELITLVGYYDLLALSLRVWRTPLPAGVGPVFSTGPAAS
jgi:alkylhydroperoxidase/carboxymuconolactone decarboxylase family protein YurZ